MTDIKRDNKKIIIISIVAVFGCSMVFLGVNQFAYSKTINHSQEITNLYLAKNEGETETKDTNEPASTNSSKLKETEETLGFEISETEQQMEQKSEHGSTQQEEKISSLFSNYRNYKPKYRPKNKDSNSENAMSNGSDNSEVAGNSDTIPKESNKNPELEKPKEDPNKKPSTSNSNYQLVIRDNGNKPNNSDYLTAEEAAEIGVSALAKTCNVDVTGSVITMSYHVDKEGSFDSSSGSYWIGRVNETKADAGGDEITFGVYADLRKLAELTNEIGVTEIDAVMIDEATRIKYEESKYVEFDSIAITAVQNYSGRSNISIKEKTGGETNILPDRINTANYEPVNIKYPVVNYTLLDDQKETYHIRINLSTKEVEYFMHD